MKKPTLKSLLRSLAIVVVVLAVVLVIIKVKAGPNLDPTGPPGDPATEMKTLEQLYCKLKGGGVGCPAAGPSSNPTAAPGSTMHTIKEVYEAASDFESNPGTATAEGIECGKEAWLADNNLVTGSACAVCKECSAGSCANLSNNTQDTTNEGGITGTCDQTCKKCSGGSCVNQTDGEDLFVQCDYGCNGSGACSPYPCGDTVDFTYRGSPVTYGTVFNYVTDECWLDRNLGASQVATGYNNSAAYGDLFQWGREDDEHQVRSPLTGQVEGDMSLTGQPGHGNFIKEQTDPYDWADNSWITRANPCPNGWRLPTVAEWEAEFATWDTQNYLGAFGSPLKLTAGGNRDYSTAALNRAGSWGYYWSSTISGTNTRNLTFKSTTASANAYRRAYGFSVRCIKD